MRGGSPCARLPCVRRVRPWDCETTDVMAAETKGANMFERFGRMCVNASGAVRAKLSEVKGQGTTEYAILVGVLVVIAIAAIVIFRPKIQELWTAIADGISGL